VSHTLASAATFSAPLGCARLRSLGPIDRAFLRNIPESAMLVNVDQMVQSGKEFDYSTIAPAMIEKSRVPSYCKA